MRKKGCIIFQLLLLVWFFLDMIGVTLNNKCLVTRSYQDDGVFFIIYLLTVILFLVEDRIGKWAVIIWTSLWFIVQFLCHEWYTIFNDGVMGSVEEKKEYFKETIKMFQMGNRYVPDAYHIILHILILCTLIATIAFTTSRRNKRERIIFK